MILSNFNDLKDKREECSTETLLSFFWIPLSLCYNSHVLPVEVLWFFICKMNIKVIFMMRKYIGFFALVFAWVVMDHPLQALSSGPHEIGKLGDVESQILDLVDVEELKRRVAGLGVGEGDAVVVQVTSEGEILEVGALDVKLASTWGIGDRVFMYSGTAIMATGYAVSALGAVVPGIILIVVGLGVSFLGNP